MLAVIPFFPRVIFHIPLPAGLPMETLEIHGFGVLVALGFLLGGWLSMWRARRHGFDADAINRLIGWLVIGTFVGGHVGYGLMYEPKEYLSHPEKFLYVWEGLSSIGGFLVCVPLTVYFFYRYKLPMWPNLDNMAVGFAMGWFFGRMGCTVAHDHPGSGIRSEDVGSPLSLFAKYCRPVEGATWDLPAFMAEQTRDYRWGPCADRGGAAISSVSDMVPADFSGIVAAHDMGFYEALMSLGILALFLVLDRRPQVPGIYPLLLGVIYGPSRILMDFARPASTDGRWFSDVIPGFDGFTAGQAGSALIFVVSLYFLIMRLRSGATPYWRSEAPPPPPEEGGAAPGESPPAAPPPPSAP